MTVAVMGTAVSVCHIVDALYIGLVANAVSQSIDRFLCSITTAAVSAALLSMYTAVRN